MKKTYFLITFLLIIPFTASATSYCVPPVATGCTTNGDLGSIGAENAASGQAGSPSGNANVAACQNQIIQYQAAELAYQNCLSSSVSAVPTAQNSSSPATTGTIQLLNFPSQLNATVNENLSVYINYIYSGKNYTSAEIISLNPAPGLEVGNVSYGANGVDNVLFSGVPTQVGDYPSTLVITDNNGAVLNQPFDLKVSDICSGIPVSGTSNPLVFTDDAQLPDATVGKLYSQNINFTDSGGMLPEINFCSNPDELGITPSSVGGGGNGGSTTLRFTPKQSGQFKIVAYALSGINYINEIGTKTFNLTVNNPSQQTNQPSQTNASTPAIMPNPTTTNNQTITLTPFPNSANQNTKQMSIPKKSGQATTISQTKNTQVSAPTIATTQTATPTKTTPAKTQAKSKNSSNIFSNIWNFIKNIF